MASLPLRQRNGAHGSAALATVAALFALLAGGCMGGTGTDTENGMEPVFLNITIEEAVGTPASNVLLSVHRPTHRADSASEPTLLVDDSLLTDANGRVSIALKNQGVYIIQGDRNDSTVLLDTLRALRPDGASGVGVGGPTYRLQAARPASGVVMLRSGFRADSGRVILRGTSHLSNITDLGSFDLGTLPPSSENLRVTVLHNSVPASRRYIRIAATRSGYVALSSNDETCVEDANAVPDKYLPATLYDGTLQENAQRWTGAACSQHTGVLVDVRLTDSSGTLLESIGNYFVPRPGVPTNGAGALPESCIRAGTSPDPRGTLDLVTGRIVVDDIRSGSDCAN